jgi:DNA-binding CsgD family transcriptional regulator
MKSQISLSDADYARLLSCIEGIHRCRLLENFPNHSLAELRRLVECKMACYAELDFARQRVVNIFDPQPAIAPTDEWLKFTADHPVLNYFKATNDGQALMISDFMGVNEYHQLDVYQNIYRFTGAEDQIGFGVQVNGSFVLGFAFDRAERSFTEEDRMLLNLIRPHIIQAYLHLEELAGREQLQRDLQTALRENGLGVIVLNDARSVIHATPGTFEKLATYIPVPTGKDKLPESLMTWAFGNNSGEEGKPYTIHHDATRLTIRRVRQRDRRLLLLSEENRAAAEGLTRYQLTPRELEVLRWITDGKSNAEIAIILGVSAGTAKIHVEHILSKLGVENRTAAAALFCGGGA